MAPQAGAELHPGDPRLSAAELLGGARRARERERAQGAAATVERITVGRWLAALHERCAFPQEGAATFAAWVEEHLEFGAQMARRYMAAGRLELSVVQGRDLSVDKLAALSRADGWLQPALATVAEGCSLGRLRRAVRAGAASFAAHQDQARACAEALAVAAGQQAPAPAGGAKAALVKDAERCLRALQETLRALRSEERAVSKEQLAAQQQALAAALAALTAPAEAIDNAEAGSRLPEAAAGSRLPGAAAKTVRPERSEAQSKGAAAGSRLPGEAAKTVRPERSEAQSKGAAAGSRLPGAAAKAVRPERSEAQSKDAAAGSRLPEAEAGSRLPEDESAEDESAEDESAEDEPDAAPVIAGITTPLRSQAPAAAPPVAAPPPSAPPAPAGPPQIQVTTEQLARALCEGLSDAEQVRLSNALLGILARYNEPWTRRSRNFLTMAVQQAQRCGHMLPVVGAALLTMCDGSAAHFKNIFGIFLHLNALPCFRADLDMLCSASLSAEERAQVRAAAARYPLRPPITDPVYRESIWRAHDELHARLPPPEL